MLLGSFYLLNLILAIVAMSYDEVRKQDKEDAEAEAKEQEVGTWPWRHDTDSGSRAVDLPDLLYGWFFYHYLLLL